MADDAIDLRQDAFRKRITNIGGNHIQWPSKDVALIRDYVMSTPAEIILRNVPQHKLVRATSSATILRELSKSGIVVRDLKPEDRSFLFVVSSEDVDLAGDVVKVDGVDCANFLKNPVVLNAHNSSALPIAASTSPALSGKTLTAVAKFPRLGVNECSDEVAGAIKNSLVRGASIGFVPLKWSFTKDAQRPFGIDFHEIRLLEWSVCAIPCNASCLLLGAVDGKSVGVNSPKMIERWLEARAITDKARSIIASISDDTTPSTREQRIAEARNFRLSLNGGGK